MERRQLLKSIAFGSLAATPTLAVEAARVTVTDLEIFTVKINRRGNWLLIRLHTSAGVHGIGEASHGKDELVVKLLRQFSTGIKGRGIFEIEWLRETVKSEIAESGISAAVALSGLEQCLWDIQGKIFGVPVCELLGGRLRDRIRNYANINRSTEQRTPAGFAATAEKAVAAGFDAIKLAPFDGMPSAPHRSGQTRRVHQAGARMRRRRAPGDRAGARSANRRAQPFRSGARPRSDPPLRTVELVLAGGGDARPTDRVVGDHQSRGEDAHRWR